jgi:cytochrome P450
VELCGRFVPAGVEVACSPYVLSRSRDMFGDDANDFRPERYLDSSPEWVAKAARYDFTFGYGPRQCIGQTLSHFITCKAVVQVSAQGLFVVVT